MFIAKLTAPDGQAMYLPYGFGHTCHEWAREPEQAQAFVTHGEALQKLLAFVRPPSFWESERRHAELCRKKYAGHKIDILPIDNLTKASLSLPY